MARHDLFTGGCVSLDARSFNVNPSSCGLELIGNMRYTAVHHAEYSDTFSSPLGWDMTRCSWRVESSQRTLVPRHHGIRRIEIDKEAVVYDY